MLIPIATNKIQDLRTKYIYEDMPNHGLLVIPHTNRFILPPKQAMYFWPAMWREALANAGLDEDAQMSEVEEYLKRLKDG